METIQEFNLETTEEQFGAELAKKIKYEIEYCEKDNAKYKIQIINQSKTFTHIVFATRAYSTIYEISNRYKRIEEENFIGSVECRKVMDIMNILSKA